VNVCWFVNDFDLHDLAFVFFVVKNESKFLLCYYLQQLLTRQWVLNELHLVLKENYLFTFCKIFCFPSSTYFFLFFLALSFFFTLRSIHTSIGFKVNAMMF